MAEITAAIDEQGANDLFGAAIAALPPMSTSGASNLGPFTVSYSASATVTNGSVDLRPPGVIRIANLRLDWHVTFSFGVDLNDYLPPLHIPSACVDIPCVGEVCTPEIDIPWPSITIPVSFGDFVESDIDFTLSISQTGGQWRVEAVVQGVPNLEIGASTAAALLAAIALELDAIVTPIAGPFANIVVDAILGAIAIADLTGFLGPILTPFVSGLRIPIYNQPVNFEVLPAESPVDPAITITIDTLTADVQHNAPEDELVLTADISA
jgi:hypothetical protein